MVRHADAAREARPSVTVRVAACALALALAVASCSSDAASERTEASAELGDVAAATSQAALDSIDGGDEGADVSQNSDGATATNPIDGGDAVAEAGPEPAGETTSPDQPASDPSDEGDPPIEYGDRFPEVLAVRTAPVDGDDWRFDVTLSSPYDTPERYADAWRVLDGDDHELGIRVLLHDHANEQPFTRSTTVTIPDGVTEVFVEGRDQANGWSGQRFAVDLSAP